MSNPNYGFPSPSSFTTPYSSTPPAGLRPSRPRFGYSGPSMYPRPRSSASKPNPDSSFSNVRTNNFDSNLNVDVQNKLNDASFHTDNSNTSLYYSCNESVYESPKKFYGGLSKNLQFQEPINDNNFNQFVQNSGNDEQHYSNATSQNMYSGNSIFFSPECNPQFSHDTGLLSKSSRNFQFHNNISNQNEFREGSNFGTQHKFLHFQQNSNLPHDKKNIHVNKVPLGGFQNFRNPKERFKNRVGTAATRKKFKAKSMANRGQMRCELCNLDFTSSIPLEMHLRGAKHNKKLKAQSALEVIQLQGNKEIDAIGKAFRCELCGLTLNSSLQLQMHLEGNRHKNKILKLEQAKEIAKVKQDFEKASKEDLEMACKDDVEMACKDDLKKTCKEDSETNCKENSDKICKVDSEVTDAVKNTEQNGKGNESLTRPLPEDFDNPRPTKIAKYSCDICNLILNSEIQLQQHLGSKKHEAKVSGKPLVKSRKVKKEKQVTSTDAKEVESAEEPEQSKVLGVKSLTESFIPGEVLE